MLWIVQKNLDNHNRRYELLNILTRLEIPFLDVNVKNYEIDKFYI